MRKTTLGLAAALLISLASAASAEDGITRVQVMESDLQSDAAIATLHDRLVTAADAACREVPAFDRAAPSISACSHRALDQAIKAADLAPLTAYHQDLQTRG